MIRQRDDVFAPLLHVGLQSVELSCCAHLQDRLYDCPINVLWPHDAVDGAVIQAILKARWAQQENPKLCNLT